MSDDGFPDARLAAALQAWSRRPGAGERAEVLAALSGARVFLALAARELATEVSPTTGLLQERTAEMALVSVVRPDGARALPVFSDGHAVQRWRPEARPVPVPGPRACATALDDGAVALLLDPPKPALLVTHEELTTLARGHVPVPGTTLTSRRAVTTLSAQDSPFPEGLVAAVAEALDDEPVRVARLLAGPDGPVLGVAPAAPMDAAALAGLAARTAGRLGAHLPPDGLDLAVVPDSGPGQVVPLRRRSGWWRRRRA